MEWLFPSCHNYWIVCHLCRDDGHPFLAYSPKTTKDFSEPFRAFLGGILPVLIDTYIESSTFNPNMQFDTIVGDTDDARLPEDTNDRSGAYLRNSSRGGASEPQMTCYVLALVLITLSLSLG